MRAKKEESRMKRVGNDTLAIIDFQMNDRRHQLVYLSEDRMLCIIINRDTRATLPYLITIEDSNERIYSKRYSSLEALVEQEPFDLSKFSYVRK